VDVLAPSALEEVITKENAPRVKAKIVEELANGRQRPKRMTFSSTTMSS